jgi:hydroxymethylpyrimidine pyrophosphatase-like HAD family hydrolase
MSKTIAFDFDGVVNRYRGEYKGDDVHEVPNDEVVRAMRLLREKGYKIIIHSTKSSKTIRAYCTQYGIEVDYINENPEVEVGNPGKPRAEVYVDDHALCYRGQGADELVAQITAFVPYYRA